MSNTENLGPEYHDDKNKDRLRGRKIIWSRRKSSPWTFTMLIIVVLIVAAGAVAVTYLVNSHPGKPEANPTIDTPAAR
ncbi:hypothetical protein [Agrobacterium rosae]|uniref:Uncharacterized protein n=1 Tax=Agrobacterium rosae TaxID=1972867 RepID=A0A1R3TB80_9HYPH|nr:hypothetical protein [Agrobacterium rosae]KAA3512188.1 hypothetical protein DXM21_11615 [Agrobacterium rosae]KAA3520362.1 hypothetical protein DXM25_12005 [Agrobacterium rosae]MBN7808043.1 hypothetical protein [Agrobacterium rosae]MCM2432249.1 hypothetical protein [Agrobacterium rosae]MDX8327611.1 hypothetical protein [Agrobacterium rosae]